MCRFQTSRFGDLMFGVLALRAFILEVLTLGVLMFRYLNFGVLTLEVLNLGVLMNLEF